MDQDHGDQSPEEDHRIWEDQDHRLRMGSMGLGGWGDTISGINPFFGLYNFECFVGRYYIYLHEPFE